MQFVSTGKNSALGVAGVTFDVPDGDKVTQAAVQAGGGAVPANASTAPTAVTFAWTSTAPGS